MSSHHTPITPALADYLYTHGVKETPLLQELRAQTVATFEAAPMQISPTMGQFLRFLLETIGAKNVLEIGTFTGYSASCMALATPDDGHVTCCDLSYDWTRLAVQYWQKMGLQNKITLHLAPALTTLQSFVDQGLENNFDFVFIDADKPNYIAYYEYSLKLVRPNGLIAIDNVLWSGEVVNMGNQNANTNIIRQLNDQISQDNRVSVVMLPIDDGVTLIRKKPVL